MRDQMTRLMRAALAVGLSGCIVLLASGSASAATTIGQNGADALDTCGAGNTFIQTGTATGVPSYAVPAGGGVITSWSFLAGSTTGEHDRLKVVRSDGTANQFVVVGEQLRFRQGYAALGPFLIGHATGSFTDNDSDMEFIDDGGQAGGTGRSRTGQVRFAGRDMTDANPREAVRAGLAHVVEGHRVFTQLSVFDNLLLAGYGLAREVRIRQVDEALAFFPEIAAKRNDRAVTLSGGQQQMLAVAQGLVGRPRLLMLDEPSAGLSPVLVDRVLAAIERLRDAGTAVLLVEQLIEKALAAVDRVYALARGSIVLEAQAGEADLPNRLEHAYFGADVSAPLTS